jgi:hypothetical protein
MNRRILILALLATVIGVAWLRWRGRSDGASEVKLSSPPLPTNNRPGVAADAKAASSESRSDLADALSASTTDIRADLRLVLMIVDTFRSNFPRDGNPVGNNAEITAALTGRNRLRLALIPPDHPVINAKGELCDRWGTPFFFHAESAAKMEIRSAGPDKKMWTSDDVTLAP